MHEMAIALSMVKRLRELAFGIPGLVAWQWSEGRHLAALARTGSRRLEPAKHRAIPLD